MAQLLLNCRGSQKKNVRPPCVLSVSSTWANYAKYLRILKTNFKSQHANKNNKVSQRVAHWLPYQFSEHSWHALKTLKHTPFDGCRRPQIKQKALNA